MGHPDGHGHQDFCVDGHLNGHLDSRPASRLDDHLDDCRDGGSDTRLRHGYA